MTPDALSPLSQGTYGAAALVGLGVALFLIARRDRSPLSLALLLAVVVTVLWSAAVAYAAAGAAIPLAALSLGETAKTAGWIVLLVMMLARSWRLTDQWTFSLGVALTMGFVFTLQLLIDSAHWLGWTTLPSQEIPEIASLFVFGRLMTAIGGLVLVHNLFVSGDPDTRWSLRLMCVGLAGLFGYDVHLYSVTVLYGALNPDLFAARGLVQVIILPLIGWTVLRSADWTRALKVSRKVVFSSLSLVAVGLYLLVMSALAYGVRLVGGDYGRLFQIGFLFATIIGLALVLFSGKFRSWAKVMINKHFFALKYDYRDEWLRFIATASGTGAAVAGAEVGAGASGQQLERRIIQAVCDIVDSPGGVLWLPDDEQNFVPSARWNFRTSLSGLEEGRGPFVRFLADRGRIVDFDEMGRGEGDYDGMARPDWAEARTRAWLAVPLIHLERLTGFLVIEQPRAARVLNWEDFDLLRTVGRQAASYIAEAATQKALVEAGKFEEFNRRFAFIMHDIKNLVSQLSLLLRNAERHADNPAFQRDMMLTLKDSVDKMNDMLVRLGQHNTGKADLKQLDVRLLADAVVAEKTRTYRFLTSDVAEVPVMVAADAGRLEQVFVHLVQNAIDAAPQGSVHVAVSQRGNEAVIEVADTGVGMSEEFVRNQLFQPFLSTKPGGFGVGAYEAREIVRSLGGRIEVQSAMGEGTRFRVRLPLVREAAVAENA